MRIYILLVLLAFHFQNCSVPYTTENSNMYIQKPGRENKRLRIVWADDFNRAEIDTTKWVKIPNTGEGDWKKHLSFDERCYLIEDGKLHLRGILNPDTIKDNRKYLAGGLYSKGKFAFQYGKIEVRAKFKSGKGAWPAIWMLPATDKYGDYPRNGEIDILEHLNFDKFVYQTIHSYYTLNLKQKDNPPHYATAAINPGDFNIFSLQWFPDKIVYGINGKETFTYPKVNNVDPTQWPFNQPFYILIDQQLEGNWVGKADPADLPVEMIIDWVKVYQ